MSIATFTIEVLRDGDELQLSDKDKRVLADLPAYLEELEENLTDLLPEGYSVSIKEWDDE